MSKYEVKSVVCDYGVFEDNELKLICNSHANALKIKEILETDSDTSKPYVWQEKTIADLEAKLARTQNELSSKVDYIHELVEVKDDYKQQLAEKEKEYQDAISNFVNLENTRAILQLEKVKWIVDDIQYTCGDDNNIDRDFLIKEIDNQIEELKKENVNDKEKS